MSHGVLERSGEEAGEPPQAPTPGVQLETDRHRLRIGLVGCWVGLLGWSCVANGIPFDRAEQTLWILGGLVVASAGRPWRRVLRIFTDWLPFVGFLYLYDYSRGAADALGMPVHITEPLAVDRFLSGGHLPTLWLRDLWYQPDRVNWWDVVLSLTYMSHFVTVWIIAAVLYGRSRQRWAAFARRLLVLSYAGLVTYVLFPAAPPWYAAQQGLLPPIERTAARGFSAIGLHTAVPFIEQGQARVNEVAAVPSLHAAFAMLICVFFWKAARPAWRVLLATYPVAMSVSLMYGGEHYLVDILLGGVYVAGTMWVVSAAERRWLA
jgi:hypothetical protein